MLVLFFTILTGLGSRAQTVYLGGPLFNRHERLEMEEIAHVLQTDGYRVFLPHRDGFLLATLQPYLVEHHHLPPEVAGSLVSRAVDALDVYQVVVGCDAFVLNLNGRVPDEGALVEASMAWILGKPVVAYRDDVRSLTKGILNPLVAGRADFTEVARMHLIPRALRAIPFAPPAQYVPPAKVQRKLREGETLWRALVDIRAVDAARETEVIGGLIVDLFGACALDI